MTEAVYIYSNIFLKNQIMKLEAFKRRFYMLPHKWTLSKL